jgi:hypothetical protein
MFHITIKVHFGSCGIHMNAFIGASSEGVEDSK